MRALLLAVLLVAPLAGCVGWPLQDEAAPRGAQAVEPAPLAAPQFLPPDFAAVEPSHTLLDVRLELAEVWVKPLQEVRANLTAPGASRTLWFAGLDGALAHLTVVNGHPFLTNESQPGPHRSGTSTTEPGHDHRERTPLDTGMVEPDGRPFAIALRHEGRYVLETPMGANLTILLHGDAPAGSPDSTFLVRDEAGERFVPGEVELRPGQRVLVWNQVGEATRLVERSFLPLLPGGGGELAFTPVDEGIYRVVAIVRDGATGRGESVARVLVDFERPSTRTELGPYVGRFTPGPAAQSSEHGFAAQAPVRALTLHLRTHSPLPETADVRLTLMQDGRVLHEHVGGGTNLTFEDLPAGRFTLVVSPGSALWASYELSGTLEVVLPTPPALAETR